MSDTVQKNDFFSYAGLTHFFESIRERFRVGPLGKWDGQPGIILRHDVDIDVAPAFAMARLERERALSSSFFILTTSTTYNPAAIENRQLLRQMSEWGFEIGLHFDPSVYGEDPDDVLAEHLELEVQLLASIVGRPVTAVSLHNPTSHGRYPLFDGYHNAYDPKVFDERRYLSDSRMVFRHDPYDFIERADGDVIQILLHPAHFSESGGGYPVVASRHIRSTVRNLDSYIRPKNEIYAKQISIDRVEEMVRLIDLQDHER